VRAVEGQRAGIRLIDAAHQVEKGRFPSAIRADDGEHSAVRNLERNVPHRAHAAEALVQAGRAKQRAHGLIPRKTSFARTSRAACTSPPGMNSTTSVSATPYTTRRRSPIP